MMVISRLVKSSGKVVKGEVGPSCSANSCTFQGDILVIAHSAEVSKAVSTVNTVHSRIAWRGLNIGVVEAVVVCMNRCFTERTNAEIGFAQGIVDSIGAAATAMMGRSLIPNAEVTINLAGVLRSQCRPLLESLAVPAGSLFVA